MNKIFTLILIVGLSLMLKNNPTEILSTFTTASSKAVTLSITLLGIYAFWLGLLEILDKTKLNEKLSKLLSPLIKKLFGTQSEKAKKLISVNLSSNMLGMGNASTPSGIEAIKEMDKCRGKITKPMIMLMIINTAAIQLVPTTIIGLRAVAGSTNPTSIVLPTLLATGLSTLVGITLVIIIDKIIKKHKGSVK